MTNEPDGLLDLLSELVDSGPSPARAERLRALLRDDPAAQDLYLRFMKVHAQLHLDYDAGSEPVGMPGGSSMPRKPLWSGPIDPADDFGFGAGQDAGLHGPSWGWVPASASAVGWCLAVLLAIGLVAAVRKSRPPEAAIVESPAPGKVDTGQAVAVVIQADGVVWEMAGGRSPKEGEVLPRGRLEVRAGRAAFAMLSGVTVVVEGPAELELESVERIACKRGKLRARVPEGAEGFVVSGPGTAVVDLGTEFGINIRGDGKSRGRVFKGEVEAAVLGNTGALRHSRLLEEGNGAFEIDPESGLIGPLAGPEDFAGPFLPTRAALGLAPGYRGTILGARPRSYWRFESESGGAIPNEVPGGPPLRVRGPLRLEESAPGNRCVVFGPGQADQSLLMEGAWKPERSTGYAVELWFQPEMIGLAALVSMIAPKDTTHHLSLIELTASNRLTLFRPASVRFLYRWPTGRGGGDNVFSEGAYVPYRWHHLVAQLVGDRMELYVDGVAQASQAVDSTGSTAPCQVILGRLTTLTESKTIHHTGFRRPFVGLMDEVAFYDRPLTTEEIQAHYRLATRPD